MPATPCNWSRTLTRRSMALDAAIPIFKLAKAFSLRIL
nr:hypothetical protein [uncultured bacterium]